MGRLETEEVRRLAAAAAAAGVTVNDWLLRDFFVAVADFRGRHQAVAAGELDQFRRAHEFAPSRRPSPAGGQRGEHGLSATHADPDRGSRRPAAEHPRRYGLDPPSPVGPHLRVGRWRFCGRCRADWPAGPIADAAKRPAPFPISAGPWPIAPAAAREKIVAGNVVLEGIDFFAPVRDGTAVTVTLVYYAGGLQVCMQYDSRRIAEAQADDLLATYLQRIRTSPDLATRTVQAKAA